MILFSICLLLLSRVRDSRATNENVFRIAPMIEEDNTNATSNLQYDNYNENMLPLLSKDLTLIEQAIHIIEDEACKDQVRLMLDGLRNLTTWAVKFYDSSGKLPEGILAGSVYQLGNFDECLDIADDDDAPQGIRGQYCLTEVDVRAPEVYLNRHGSMWEAFKDPEERYQETASKLYWGICVPGACAPQAVEEVLRRILGVAFSGSRLKLTPKIPQDSCFKKEPPVVNTLDIIYMSIILSIISIVVAGTFFHALYMRKNSVMPNGTLPQILISFSLIANLKKLLSTPHNNDMHLDCISGVKFISMTFIVAGHALMFVFGGPIMNKKFTEEAIPKVASSVFVNNPLLVDTFLLISGFLFCRILLGELDKKKSVNILFLYIVRYIRLTPAYFIMIGLYVTWLSKLDDGPLWARMELERERCLSSWWTNLLYVNNYIDTDNLCMFQSWYLSVDTQLFILAPAIIYPLWRWRTIGEWLLACATFISMIVPFVVTFVNNLDPTLMVYIPEIKDVSSNEYFKRGYIKTHMRAEAYCFGILFGYILYRLQTTEYQLSKKVIRFGWFIAIFSLTVSMFSISIFYGPRKDYTPIEAAIYSSLHRAFWSIGTGWVLLASITNNSGPIKSFLKWKFFIPFSRLQYSAYLVNGLVELHSYSTIRSPQYLGIFKLLNIVLSHWMLTFAGAVLLSTLFESPILGIERIFLRREKGIIREGKSKQEANATGT